MELDSPDKLPELIDWLGTLSVRPDWDVPTRSAVLLLIEIAQDALRCGTVRSQAMLATTFRLWRARPVAELPALARRSATVALTAIGEMRAAATGITAARHYRH